jgi:hypothetical protein
MNPREALFDVVAVDDIDEFGYIIAKMTSLTDETAKYLLNNNDTTISFNMPECSPGTERVDFDGAVLFRACPTDHLNYKKVKEKHPDEEILLVQFLFFFDAKLSYVPQALINFVTREAIGIIWNMLLKIADDVRTGKKHEHCTVIAQKQEFYSWVERRCQFMLSKIKDQKVTTATATSGSNCGHEDHQNEWTLHEILRMNM